MKIRIIIAMIVVALFVIGAGVYVLMKSVGNNETNNRGDKGNEIINNRNNEISAGNENILNSQPITHKINIRNFAYSPMTLTIKKGDIVVWENMDLVGHTVTSDFEGELDSDLFSKGQTYSHTFNSKGTFNYHCKPHPYMKAKIIIE